MTAREICRWLVLCVACVATSGFGQAPLSAPPNVIFVLFDDLGHADLGCQGAKDIRTPHIDRLAREGVRLSDFYSNAPVCTPTRCAFITGRWQQRVGLEWALGFTAEQFRRRDNQWVPEADKLSLGLPANEQSIAKLMKAAGYATGAFGKWHLGYQPQFNPIRHGFDEYFGVLLGHADYYRYNYFDGTNCLFEGDQPAKAEGYLTDLLNQRATEFIRKHASRPFFLYVPHLAVHFPFQPPNRPEPPITRANAYDGDRRIYAQMVEQVDEGVGMMLAELERQGVLDNTLFVVSSDNGGERYSDNSPLFHHKQTLWEGGIRVPCVMRWPARLPAGKVVPQPAITMDLTATFAALAGAKATPDRPFDGINLLPILTGEQPPVERTLAWRISRTGRQQKAVRHGDWKLVEDAGITQLFNLAEDIGERRDRSIHQPEKLRELKQRLAAWEADVGRDATSFLVR